MTTPTMEAITSQFAEQHNKNEIVEILKELFDDTKLKMITDLDPDEARLVTKMLVISGMKNIKAWDDTATIFMALMLSKNRKSRSEIISGIQGYYQRVSGLARLLPQNWGRRGMPP